MYNDYNNFNEYSNDYIQKRYNNDINKDSDNSFLDFCLWFVMGCLLGCVLLISFSNQPKAIMTRARIHTDVNAFKGQHTSIPEFENAVRKQDIQNINSTRTKFNRTPVKESRGLDKIAQARAKEAYLETLHHPFTDYYSHAEKPNDPFNRLNTARRLGLTQYLQPGTQFGENAGKSNFKNMPYHDVVSRYGIGGARFVAKFINHEYVYNDASSNWGHRKNELNSSFTHVGLGCYYNPKTQRNIMIELYTD